MSNSVDPDETAHYEPSHLDLCCLLQKPIIIACGSERVRVNPWCVMLLKYPTMCLRVAWNYSFRNSPKYWDRHAWTIRIDPDQMGRTRRLIRVYTVLPFTHPAILKTH